jgi:ABC-type glycerol-3-phosphate transport system substrate-binding protein
MPQQQGLKSQFLNGWLLAMPAGVKDPELSWKFMEWFCGGEGAKARAKGENTPFVGPSSRPDPQLMRLNPTIEWFVQSISQAQQFLSIDNNPVWNEAMNKFRPMVMAPVIDKTKLIGPALQEFQRYLESKATPVK